MTRNPAFVPSSPPAVRRLRRPGRSAHAQSDAVRPEVGKPLQAAQALVKQRKGREALAEIAKAEAVPNRTANENQLIEQMRAARRSPPATTTRAIRAYEALLVRQVSGRERAADGPGGGGGVLPEEGIRQGGEVDPALLQGRRQRRRRCAPSCCRATTSATTAAA